MLNLSVTVPIKRMMNLICYSSCKRNVEFSFLLSPLKNIESYLILFPLKEYQCLFVTVPFKGMLNLICNYPHLRNAKSYFLLTLLKEYQHLFSLCPLKECGILFLTVSSSLQSLLTASWIYLIFFQLQKYQCFLNKWQSLYVIVLFKGISTLLAKSYLLLNILKEYQHFFVTLPLKVKLNLDCYCPFQRNAKSYLLLSQSK